MNFFDKKKKYILIICILTSVGCLIIFYFNSSKKTESLVDGKGYYLDVYTRQSKNDVRNGTILLNNLSDELIIDVQNGVLDREVLIKLFCDYKEIEFKIDNNYVDNYEITLAGQEKRIIPISLKDNGLTIDKLHKLTVSLIASPKKFEKDYNFKSNKYGITLNYDLITDKVKNKSYNSMHYEKPTHVLKTDQYIELMINSDFKPSSILKVPNSSFEVEKGKNFKLAYRIGDFENVNKYLVLVTLNWEQVQIDNKPYKLLEIPSGTMGYGTFEFNAPDRPGLYEFNAYVIADPFGVENINRFMPIPTAFRFTLNVK